MAVYRVEEDIDGLAYAEEEANADAHQR